MSMVLYVKGILFSSHLPPNKHFFVILVRVKTYHSLEIVFGIIENSKFEGVFKVFTWISLCTYRKSSIMPRVGGGDNLISDT